MTLSGYTIFLTYKLDTLGIYKNFGNYTLTAFQYNSSTPWVGGIPIGSSKINITTVYDVSGKIQIIDADPTNPSGLNWYNSLSGSLTGYTFTINVTAISGSDWNLEVYSHGTPLTTVNKLLSSGINVFNIPFTGVGNIFYDSFKIISNTAGHTITISTISVTVVVANTISGQTSYGYSQAIHCNYIEKITVQNLNNTSLNFNFNSTDFPFLLISGGTSGLGYTANKIQALLQIVNRADYTQESQVQPQIGQWRIIDVTNQTDNYVSGNTLTQANLVNTPFSIIVDLNYYDGLPIYNIDYLNIPLLNDNSTMNFGEEQIFLGNVSTDISASIFSTDISIQLPMNQYNTSTNKTWNPTIGNVIISEIGIYDDNQNLVAVAKLNNPIIKNEFVSPDFVIGLDF